jgi:hypothetical protein
MMGHRVGEDSNISTTPLPPPQEGEELDIEKLEGKLYFYIIHTRNYGDEDQWNSDQSHIVLPPNPLSFVEAGVQYKYGLALTS